MKKSLKKIKSKILLRGFTLVELLAVIVILAIIMLQICLICSMIQV